MEIKLIDWTEAMSVDGAAVDESHKKLVSLINRLHLVVNCGADCDSVSNILCELADYAGAGFLEEEKLMSLMRFPDKDTHITDHWIFIDRLTIFIADFERGVQVGNDILMFLIRWMSSHVKVRDGAFSAYYLTYNHQRNAQHRTVNFVAA